MLSKIVTKKLAIDVFGELPDKGIESEMIQQATEILVRELEHNG